MPANNYTSNSLVVEWTPDGGSLTTISNEASSFKNTDQATEIEAPKFGAPVILKYPGKRDMNAEVSYLHTIASGAGGTAFAVGTTGVLVWYPQGKVSTKPKFTVSEANIMSNDIPYEVDKMAMSTIKWHFNAAPVEGTVT
jgi:hypothetical protein